MGVSHEYIRQLNPKKNVVAILNTDPIGMPGQHWVALFTRGNKMYYYDSLGDEPLPAIVDWWHSAPRCKTSRSEEELRDSNKQERVVVYYDSQQQPDESNKCGFYALQFIENASKQPKNAPDFAYYDMGLDYLKPTQKNERVVIS